MRTLTLALALTAGCDGAKPSAAAKSAESIDAPAMQHAQASAQGAMDPKPVQVTGPIASSPKPHPAPASAEPSAEPARYPIRWSKRVELQSLDDVQRQLDAARPDSFGDLELGGETVHPATCAEWTELHGRGFTPETTIDEGDDGLAKERCETLALLKRARPSKVSFVRKLGWNRGLLRLLPATIASQVDPDKRKAAAAAASAGQTFGQFDPKAKAKLAREVESLEISEGDRNGFIYLYPLVWGDVDADETEDLVVSVMNADAHGPMTSLRVMVVTRKSLNEPLRVVEWR